MSRSASPFNEHYLYLLYFQLSTFPQTHHLQPPIVPSTNPFITTAPSTLCVATAFVQILQRVWQRQACLAPPLNVYMGEEVKLHRIEVSSELQYLSVLYSHKSPPTSIEQDVWLVTEQVWMLRSKVSRSMTEYLIFQYKFFTKITVKNCRDLHVFIGTALGLTANGTKPNKRYEYTQLK